MGSATQHWPEGKASSSSWAHREPGRAACGGARRGPSDIQVSCTGLRRPKLAGLLDFEENRLVAIVPASSNAAIARAGTTRSQPKRPGLRAAGIKNPAVDEMEIVRP
jgi:hypothetical protein